MLRRRLVPGAERAGGHVLLDALGRGAEPGVFPVVDRAGAVGGQVGQPAAGHHPLEDPRGAVAQQVGAVDQHHGRAAAARARRDLARAARDRAAPTRVRSTAAGTRRGRSGSRRPASGSSRSASGRTFELAQVEWLTLTIDSQSGPIGRHAVSGRAGSRRTGWRRGSRG